MISSWTTFQLKQDEKIFPDNKNHDLFNTAFHSIEYTIVESHTL
jgi:hypothetical protein